VVIDADRGAPGVAAQLAAERLTDQREIGV
jgi:hypothetical protein